jgi:hypothetical protein
MGDVCTLGEAYAFGVIWSFVFKTLAMVILRFKDKAPREYEVPLNIRIGRGAKRIDLPIGIGIIFLILLSTALVNLFTKKVATVWGLGFTLAFLAVFIVCERLVHRMRGGQHHEHVEQFNEQVTGEPPTPQSLGLRHPSPLVVAVRNPNSMGMLAEVLAETDVTKRDIVAITCKVLPPLTPGVTPEELRLSDTDRSVLTAVVNLAERAGKPVRPLMIPTNNPLYAVASAARRLGAGTLVLGCSGKSPIDVQMEHVAIAWGMASAEDSQSPPPPLTLTVRIIGKYRDTQFEL